MSLSSLSSLSDHEGPTSRRRNVEKLNAFEKYKDEEFLVRFRLSKDTILYLDAVFGSNLKPLTKRNRALQPVDQILITLRYYATGSFQRVIGDIFHVEQATVHRIIHRVTAEIAKMSSTYIKMPTSEEFVQEANKFYAIANFPRVIGAVDCTHIKVNSPGGDSNGDTTSSSASAPTHEYFINGKRISDGMEVLECTIKKDFQYNKVMPTFHHWVTDEKRFGLTFQTAADARAFDKGVRTAIEELLDGLGGAWPSLHAYKKHNPAPKDDDEEQNIFECLNLPSESRSSSETSSGSRARRRPPDDITQTPILSAITLPRHPLADSLKQYEYDERLHVEDSDPDRCPYVHLSAVHEYTYPQVSGAVSSEKSSPNTKPPLLKRDSGSIKKCGYSGPPPLPDKKPAESFHARIKCRHCHEWYLESANRPGACEFAPDCFRSCIDCVSCIRCAQCMLYHCMSDAEGDFAMHPCACGPPDENCAKRWLGISLLSLLVPCLCCYGPLRALHRLARAGGLHAPATL